MPKDLWERLAHRCNNDDKDSAASWLSAVSKATVSRSTQRAGLGGRLGQGFKVSHKQTKATSNLVTVDQDQLFPSQRADEDLAWLNRFVIRKDSSWKRVFDLFVTFASCYSIFVNAYFAVFGLPT